MEKRKQIIDLLNKCIIGESVANTADRILALFNVSNAKRTFTACPSCGSENIHYQGWWTCKECTYDWGSN